MKRRRFDSSDDDDDDDDYNGNYNHYKNNNDSEEKENLSFNHRQIKYYDNDDIDSSNYELVKGAKLYHADLVPFAVDTEKFSDEELSDRDDNVNINKEELTYNNDAKRKEESRELFHQKESGLQNNKFNSSKVDINAVPQTDLNDNALSSSTNHLECSQVEADVDVPTEFNGLLSDSLLQIYRRTLFYWSGNANLSCKNDNKSLLRKYTPQTVSKYTITNNKTNHEWGNTNHALDARKVFDNKYNISPGWRWDGAIRGRSDYHVMEEMLTH